MKCWIEDLLDVANMTGCDIEIFRKIEAAAYGLGFEYCAYGLRVPLPASNPKTHIRNNYPVAWQERYQEAGYLNTDPTVLHGRQTQAPIVWEDSIFKGTPAFWAEAKAAGLRIGWAQSCLDATGTGSMLTLARSCDVISKAELEENECKMRFLVSAAHLSLTRVLAPKLNMNSSEPLTHREIEVLKWTADGKTSSEISDILLISVNTVNFHVKNATLKLSTPNKTAAVVRAAVMGLLN